MPRRQQDVVGFDVAVDHSGEMRILQSRCDILENANDLDERHCPLALDARMQRFAREQRHRVVQEPTRLAGREYGHDQRMPKTGRDVDLLTKAGGVERGDEVWRDHLERDWPPQRSLSSGEHATHPAAKLALEQVVVAQRPL
jgi:hypothetical protein